MSDIKVDGVLIPQAEFKRLVEMEDELHKARMAKSIIVYIGESKVTIQYNSKEDHITYLAEVMKETTHKDSVLFEQKQIINELRGRTYHWSWAEYTLAASCFLSISMLVYRVFFYR